MNTYRFTVSSVSLAGAHLSTRHATRVSADMERVSRELAWHQSIEILPASESDEIWFVNVSRPFGAHEFRSE